MNRRAKNRGGNSTKICHEFKRSGRCKRGDNCTFSHDASNNYQAPRDDAFDGVLQAHDDKVPLDDERGSDDKVTFLEWTRLLNHKQNTYVSPFGFPSQAINDKQSDFPKYPLVSQFFKLGLKLVEGHNGADQEMVQLLATEDGLNFIRATIEKHVQDAVDPQLKIDVLREQIVPFLRLITHPHLSASNVLEEEVAIIYTFLFDVNASRMDELFGFVMNIAATWKDLHVDDLDLMSVFAVSLAALARAIDCSTTSSVSDSFKSLVNSFSRLIENSPAAQTDYWRIQATKHLDYLRLRMATVNTTSSAVVQGPPIRGRDLPGTLSEDGPRHDNDHEDIFRIRLLPTNEELTATRSEYLPTNKSSEWHLSGIHGRIDREFRLLREDTVGQLRNQVRLLRGLIRTKGNKGGGTSTPRYEEAVVQKVDLGRFDGLELTVRCKQPLNVQRMGDAAREQYWETCKNLQSGNLVCVMEPSIGTGKVQFFTISDATLRMKARATIQKDDKQDKRDRRRQDKHEDNADPLRLSYNSEHLYVTLNLVDTSAADLDLALQWFRGNGSSHQRYLVEFPGTLFASFKYTLEALQQLSRKPDLPFTNLIAPEPSDSESEAYISPPLYSQAPGFSYDLTCLTVDKKSLTVGVGHSPTADEVASRTGLDPTQSEALLNTLSREFSLIQGPPGTGKSFTGEKIIQVLLANKAQAKLGPIVCVCYTNHALDQLLEHLLENGIEGVIRLGGQSKSERLVNLNLNVAVQKSKKTVVEVGKTTEALREKDSAASNIKRLLDELAKCESAESIKAHLRSNHPVHFKDLFPDGGPVQAGRQMFETGHKEDDVIQRWLDGGKSSQNVRKTSELAATKLSVMTQEERRAIFNTWFSSIRDSIITEIIHQQTRHDKATKKHEQIRRELRSRCIEEANVIGMTTSGAARELALLRKLSSKVLVCEEAGEVLESHILTSLLPSLQHAILIGDHQQLRPQINNYNLQTISPAGAQYSLDMSLFERLVQPPHIDNHRLPFSTLLTQRRMHPSIAEMVRSTLYNKLQDASEVRSYPEVVGMKQRLFWFNHGHQEDIRSANADNTSRSNSFEVKMVAKLVSHIVKQGVYKPQDIAVLTPYAGQLQRLHWQLQQESNFMVDVVERDLTAPSGIREEESGDSTRPRKELVTERTLFDSLRLATVDNFQGEEAKIVIISLVRSNRDKDCGFLKTSNRINVLLSRAKHGYYIIGDAGTYGHVPMWNKVISLLRAGGNFGEALELRCPRHPKTVMSIAQPDRFATLSPEGGCGVPCDQPLNCGHACDGLCHSDTLHKAVFCHQKCERPKKGCGHVCLRECGYDCAQKCDVVQRDINLMLPCGHVLQSATCWEVQHPSEVNCMHVVEQTIPACGHVLKMACHVDVDSTKIPCTAECGDTLKCGHVCQLPCNRCLKPEKDTTLLVRKHTGPCRLVCGKLRPGCSHPCTEICHRDRCGLCEERCEVHCSHSRCSKSCSAPCTPCAQEDCASHCPHSKCTMPCAAPCDWVPCSKRCTLQLSCGHQCPSLCGEVCPDTKYCQACGLVDTLSTIVDYQKMSYYKDIDLNMDPCIFAACGDFFTKSFMDAQMKLSEHYDLDSNDNPTDIKTSTRPFSMDDVVAEVCFLCHGSLRNIARYGRIIRRSLLNAATKKFTIWSEGRHLELAERLLKEEQRLADKKGGQAPALLGAEEVSLTGDAFNQLSQMRAYTGTKRYEEILKIYEDILEYRGIVRVEEQPFLGVARRVMLATRNEVSEGQFFYDDAFVAQPRGYVRVTALMLKCNIVLLHDFITAFRKTLPRSSGIPVDFAANIAQCEELIILAQETGRPQLEVEGQIYAATFLGFAVAISEAPKHLREQLRLEGHARVRKARKLHSECRTRWCPANTVLHGGVSAAETLLTDGDKFYRPIPIAHMRALYDAMASEFRSTSHWVLCTQGHVFVAGQSWLSVEEERCSECGAYVSGVNNAKTTVRGLAAGVRTLELRDSGFGG